MIRKDKLLYSSKRIMAAVLSFSIATSTMPQKNIEIKAETINIEETELNKDKSKENISSNTNLDNSESMPNDIPLYPESESDSTLSNNDKFTKTIEFLVRRTFGEEDGSFNSWDSKEEKLSGVTIVITTPNNEEVTLTTSNGKTSYSFSYDKEQNENGTYTYKVYKQGYTTYEGAFDIRDYTDRIEVNLAPIETKTVKVVLSGLEETNKVTVKLVPLSLNGTSSETKQVLFDEESGNYYVQFSSVYQTGSYNIVVDSAKYNNVVKENVRFSELTSDFSTTTRISLSKQKYKLVYKVNENYDLHDYINLSYTKNEENNEYEYALIEYGDEILIKQITGKQITKVTLGNTDYTKRLNKTQEGLLLKVEPTNSDTTTLYIDIQIEDLKISELDITSTSEIIAPAPNASYTFNAAIYPEDAYVNDLTWDISLSDKNAKYSIAYSEDKKSVTVTLDKSEKGNLNITVKDAYSGKVSKKTYNIVKNIIDLTNYIDISGKQSEEYAEWYTDAVNVKIADSDKLFAFVYPNGKVVKPTSEYVDYIGSNRTVYIYNKQFTFDITKLFNFTPVVGESNLNIKIDNTAPIFEEISDTINTTGKLTIGLRDYGTITPMEDTTPYYTQGSGIKSVTYAKCDDNGNVLEEEKEATFTSSSCIIDIPYEDYNGRYIIVATDNTNHIATTYINVDTDVTKPSIDMTINNEADIKEFYNKNINMDILIKDNKDIKEAYVEIVKDNSEKKLHNLTTDTNEVALEEYLAEDGKYNVTIYARDYHNNETNKSVEVIIDTKAPVISVEYSKEGKKDGKITYYDDLIDAKLTIIEEYFDEANTTVLLDGKETYVEWQHNGNEHNAIIHFTKAKKYELEVYSIDKAGNKNTKKVNEEFVIDLEGPSINVEYDNNDSQNEKYFDDKRVATITITDENIDMDTLELIAAGNNNEKIEISKWTQVDNVHTAYVTFAQDGEYTLSVSCKDKAGHDNSLVTSNSTSPWEFVIDKTAPKVNVTYNKDNFSKNNNGINYYTGNTTATITITEKNFDKNNVTMTITSSDLKGNALAKPVVTEFVSNGNVHTAYVYYNEDSNYTFDIECIDKAGNKNNEDNKNQLTVDTKAPTGVITVSQFGTFSGYNDDIYYGLWTSNNVDVSIYTEDNISGIESVKYLKTDKKMSLTELKKLSENEWREYAEFTQTKDERFIIYAKATDKAGNVYYFNTNGIIIDKEVPSIETLAPTVTLQTPKNGIYNTDVTVDVGVKDKSVLGSYSGLNYVSYKVIKDNVEITQSGVLYVNEKKTPSKDELTQNYNGQIVIDSKLNNSNNVRLEVTAIDNAGNTITKSVEFKIDIVSPIISVEYDNNDVVNGKYFKESRTATITIYERNFDANDVLLNITSSSKSPSITEWTTYYDSANPDNTRHVAKIRFYESGDYTFDISYEDMANNVANDISLGNSVSAKEFVIDKIDPIINVTYDNNSVNNGMFYNSKRVATITITEHNFDSKDVNIAITSSNGKKVTVPAFVSNADVHTANIVFEADGVYTLAVTYKDKANREAKAIQKQEFVIDKTAPSVSIYGVENEIAYNGEIVAPVIKSSDTNFDKTIITLKDKTGKTISYSGNSSLEGENRVYTFNNILDDGIYILSAVTTDMAGNKSESEVEFSVNRKGSTYKFDDVTESLRKQYISEEKDLIIYEVNVSPLKKESMKVKLVKNGSVEILRENTDYEIIEKTTKNGWYEYVYKIYSKNFTTEGTYSVILHSEDMANNISENTLETKSADITFAIDKSKPVCIVSGIKDNTLYNTSKQKATLAISDNTKIKEIQIYVNGELYKTIDKNNEPQVLSAIYENGIMEIEFEDLAKRQNIQIRIVDEAGNEQNVEVNNILVSTNMWVRFCNNKVLVVGSIILGISIIAIIIAVIVRKRHLVLTEEKE